jgi:hypothetical protein
MHDEKRMHLHPALGEHQTGKWMPQKRHTSKSSAMLLPCVPRPVDGSICVP